jgi:predicted PurR-regulated permease PerM
MDNDDSTSAIAPETVVAEKIIAEKVDGNISVKQLLGAILAILILYTCSIASALLIPMLVSLLLSLMLAPAVRLLNRWKFPRALATVLVLGLTIAVVVGLLGSLVGPARDWLATAPKAMDRIEQSLRELRRPFAAATQATQGIVDLANADEKQKPLRVIESGTNPIVQMLSSTPAMLTSLIVTLFLTFAFLLHGDSLLRKFVELAPHLHAKKEIVLATRSAQSELSTYVFTIALINMVLGLCTAAALWAIGVDNPLLWGGVAGLLNFAPYVGPLLTSVALVVVGYSTFPTLWPALSVPGAFLALHLIEGQAITPLIVGRRLALDPVMVFLALMTLGWLWGVVGLLIAVPLMTCVKIVTERVPQWQTVCRLLSD